MGRDLPVTFGAITRDNVEQLRKINTVSFPIQYNEGFYQDVVKRNNEELNKFAYYNGFVVGAVCARLEDDRRPSTTSAVTTMTDDAPEAGPASTAPAIGLSTTKGGQRIYIMTLAVLAAYRGRGIGSQLLQSVLDYCRQHRKSEQITEIALHVQISNQDAIRFYTKRFGFSQGEMVENYYRRIDPPHCYLLYKRLDDEPETSEDM